MKKKIFSIAAVVLFASASLSANDTIKKVTQVNIEDGRASDCVREARSRTYAIASAFEEEPNDDLDFYLEIYNAIYMDCYIQ